MMIQSETISLVFGHIPYQTAQNINNDWFHGMPMSKKKPDNIPMLERGGVFASPQPERILPWQRYRQDVNLHENLIHNA